MHKRIEALLGLMSLYTQADILSIPNRIKNEENLIYARFSYLIMVDIIANDACHYIIRPFGNGI